MKTLPQVWAAPMCISPGHQGEPHVVRWYWLKGLGMAAKGEGSPEIPPLVSVLHHVLECLLKAP